MLTKALITGIPDNNSNIYKVRIPIFEDTTNTEVLYDALYCYPPGIYGGLNIGDCVYVAFEDDKLDIPVILGKLYTTVKNDDYAYGRFNNLDVISSSNLAFDTNFGNKLSVNTLYGIQQSIWGDKYYTGSEGGGWFNINLIYPVGSIYISTNNVNPSIIWRNTSWEAIEGKFLLGAGAGWPAGSTGGEVSHTLTINEMPSHTHTGNVNINTDGHNAGSFNEVRQWTNDTSGNIRHNRITNAVGGGQAHNNMPPYLAVYMWRRIS